LTAVPLLPIAVLQILSWNCPAGVVEVLKNSATVSIETSPATIFTVARRAPRSLDTKRSSVEPPLEPNAATLVSVVFDAAPSVIVASPAGRVKGSVHPPTGTVKLWLELWPATVTVKVTVPISG